MEKGLLTITACEAAELLGVNRKTVYDGLKNGQIPHRTLGRRKIISRDAFMQWLNSSDVQKNQQWKTKKQKKA